MSKIDDGGPAFPCDSREAREFAGMALRDYFAGLAMQAIVAKRQSVQSGAGNEHNKSVKKKLKLIALSEAEHRALQAGDAAGAYAIADAMLKARKAGGS